MWAQSCSSSQYFYFPHITQSHLIFLSREDNTKKHGSVSLTCHIMIPIMILEATKTIIWPETCFFTGAIFKFTSMASSTWSFLSFWYSFHSFCFVSLWSSWTFYIMHYIPSISTCLFILYFIKSFFKTFILIWHIKMCINNVHLLIIYYLSLYII